MLQQKPTFIVKIRLSLNNAIFDCKIYVNWQMNA